MLSRPYGLMFYIAVNAVNIYEAFWIIAKKRDSEEC